MKKFIYHTTLMLQRSLRTSLRNPTWAILGLFQPMLYLLLFAPLLQPLKGLPGFQTGNPLNTYIPGLLVLTVLYSSGFVGYGLISDKRAGVIERFLVTPCNRAALILGMVLRDVIMLLLQSAILIGIAAWMGLRPDGMGILLAFVLVSLLGTSMASLSYALALALSDENALASTLNTFMLPLTLLSGILLPLALAPSIIQTISKANPFTYIVDAARALFNGQILTQPVLVGFGVAVTLVWLSLWWSLREIQKAAL